MEIKKRENIGWVDLLRVIACFLVLVSHSCDAFVAQLDADRGAFLSGVFIGSFVRACVPLFVMMSGVLLLPVNPSMGLGIFYKKRIGRIVIPLVFWSIVLPLLYFIYLNYVTTSSSPSINQADYTSQSMFVKMYTFIFNFNYDTTPLWYLYMLIGLYFIMPIISAWLQQASKRDIKALLYIWGITLLLPYIKVAAPLLGYKGIFGNMGLLGTCDWNEYHTFYYMSGFVGYLILAYYLVKYPPTWSLKRTLFIAIPMFAVGYAITATGFLWVQENYPGNYPYFEMIWLFTGINVFMMTFAVFVTVQKLKINPSPRLARMASLTFGIYLCHFIIVQIAYDIFGTINALPAYIRILIMAISSFGVSYLITVAMDYFKLTRRFVK